MEKKFVDSLIVGAGFSGMYMLLRMRNRGLNVQVIEAGTDVGGTWYWNRYPGARCDVYSVEYCYSFSKELQEEYKWPERYSAQPDILKYLKHVADKFDLKKDIKFETKVTDAIYNENTELWTVKTNTGDVYEARYFIMATGCLSVPRTPKFKGMETFKGEFYHTGQWPHEEVSFEGKRVAVIGTGSSGIQAIPVIAETAKHVSVLQRDPNFTIPAGNHNIDDAYLQDIYKRYDDIRHNARTNYTGVGMSDNGTGKSIKEFSREEAFKIMEESLGRGFAFNTLFTDIGYDVEADQLVREFFFEMIDKIVDDPKTAALLKPRTHFADRRLCLDTNYFATYNRDNVSLVDVNEDPIVEITPTGIKTENNEYEFDMIVCATGYDAMTGAISKVNIVGKGGEKLTDKWEAGPRMYLGLMSHGYPNMFAITGPGSPSVLTNMVTSIEQHVEWVDRCTKYLDENDITALDAKLEEEDKWVEHVTELAKPLFIAQGSSWYLGANVPGKPRVFMPYIGGIGPYSKICNEIADSGYQTFEQTKSTADVEAA